MALEKRWLAVPAQAFLISGTAEGEARVSDSCMFHVGQRVVLSGPPQPSIELQIKRIIGPNLVFLGSPARGITDRTDISAYLAGSTISAKEQPRPNIAPDDVIRAVYEEEPAVAMRSLLVDLCGDPISETNPLPIEGEIQVSLGEGLDTLTIFNQIVPVKDTETPIIIPNGTKRLEFHARGTSRVQWTFVSGASGSNYWTLKAGNAEVIDGVQLNSKTLYLRTSKDNEVIELRAWS